MILSVYSPDGRLSRAFSSERQKGEALQFLATQPGQWSSDRILISRSLSSSVRGGIGKGCGDEPHVFTAVKT